MSCNYCYCVDLSPATTTLQTTTGQWGQEHDQTYSGPETEPQFHGESHNCGHLGIASMSLIWSFARDSN